MLKLIKPRVRHDNGCVDVAEYRCPCGGTVHAYNVWGNSCDRECSDTEYNMCGQMLVSNWRSMPDDGSDPPDY